MVKLSAIQLNSVPNVDDNLAVIHQQLTLLCAQPDAVDGDHIVVLPECCLFFGGTDSQQLSLAKSDLGVDKLKSALAKLASDFNVILVAGSIPQYQAGTEKFTNTCCVFDQHGKLLTSYNKLHLFDVEVADNERHYRESKYTQAGDCVKMIDVAGVTLGLTICYDLRFPELFRHLRQLGAEVIVVPSAFTKVTGNAHWHTLLRARAIENQVYVVAAGQVGVHANGRETYGHSMIIDPWGEILEQLPNGIGSVTSLFNREKLQQVRQSIPVACHNQFTTKLKQHE